MIPIGSQNGPWPWLYYSGQDGHGATYWTCDGYSYVSPEMWLKIDWYQSPMPWMSDGQHGPATEWQLKAVRDEIERRMKATGQMRTLWEFDTCAPRTFEPVRCVIAMNTGGTQVYRRYLRVWTRLECLMAAPCRLLVRFLNKIHYKTVTPEQFWAKVQARKAEDT